jgi:hypothetical protein
MKEKIKTLLEKGIKESYEIFLKQGSKTSKRVDKLHSSIVECVSLMFPDSKIRVEVTLKTIDSLKVDIFIDEKTVILVKFPMTSFNKNYHNSYRNIIAESWELKKVGYKVYHAYFLRDTCPNCKKDGSILTWEVPTRKHKAYDLLKEDKELIDGFYMGVVNFSVNFEKDVNWTPGPSNATATAFISKIEDFDSKFEKIEVNLTDKYESFYDTFKSILD